MSKPLTPLEQMKADAKEVNRRLRKKWGMKVEPKPQYHTLNKQAERVNEMLKKGNRRDTIAGILNISVVHVGRIIREYGLPRED
tara:strand:+ start:1125 stop:1376 length:252 start_codon:yes stop_codon:yes gene_type:complete